MKIDIKSTAVTASFFGLLLLGMIGLPAYAEAEGDYKLTYEKICGSDVSCLVFNYCTGCHQGLVVGTTVISQGIMKPLPGNYGEWTSRLERMSNTGCHIPRVLIPSMAAHLDSLDNAPLTAAQKAKAKAEAKAKAKAARENPGKSNVEFYCIGCHNGLTVGTTVIGAGYWKPKPRTYDEWVAVIQRMSKRNSIPENTAGANIPPALIPAMAAYLDSLDN